MAKLKLVQISTLRNIIIEFYNNHRKQFLFLFFLLVIEGVLSALSVIAIIPLADFLIDQTLNKASKITTQTISILTYFKINAGFWIFGIIFLTANLLKQLFSIFIRYGILNVKYKVIRSLFADLLDNVFKAKWSFFNGANHGMLINTLNKELNTIGDTFGHIVTSFALLIQIIIYLIIPVLLSPKITILTIFLCVVFCLPLLLFNKLSYKFGKKNNSTANEVTNVLNEIIFSAKIIIGYARQNYATKKYINSFDKHINVTLKSQTLESAVPKLFQPLGMIAVIISLGSSINTIKFSELAAVMWSLLGAIPLISTVLQNNVSINNFLPSYEQLNFIRNQAKSLKEISGNILFESLNNNIIFSNINFNYPNRENTLKSINLNIQKGHITALIGKSGSGKSTIIDLLLGLQDNYSGNIFIDHFDMKDLNKSSFREKIGYVPQDAILFNATISENLLWSNPNATESEIWAALNLANAFDFVSQLPDGLNTIIGNSGSLLSGGQKQRISLARALLKKPLILILDEATSSLDFESEKLIQNSIEKISISITIIIIAHRINTIKNANIIYILDSGIIKESGTYIELINKQSSYLNNINLLT